MAELSRRTFLKFAAVTGVGLILGPPLLKAAQFLSGEQKITSSLDNLRPMQVDGLGEVKINGSLPQDTYNVFTVSSLVAAGIPKSQILSLPENPFVFSLYEVTAGGEILLQGILLPAAVASFCISGGMQDMIEGPTRIYDGKRIITIDRSMPDQPIEIQYINQVDAEGKTIDQSAQPQERSADSSQPNNEWKPPPKDYCGEDMVRYYAHLLLDENLGMLLVGAWTTDPAILDNPERLKLNIFKDTDKFEKESKAVGERLREKSCYFYGDQGSAKGSVFMDYKILRDQYMKSLGETMGETGAEAGIKGHNFVSSLFNSNMSTQEAFDVALKTVSKWWP